jgi:predicted N-acetyltransferase YhbS
VRTGADPREDAHQLDLSYGAHRHLLVGSVRFTRVCIGDTPALMLGPLTIEPPFRTRHRQVMMQSAR